MAATIQRIGVIEKHLKKIQWGKMLFQKKKKRRKRNKITNKQKKNNPRTCRSYKYVS